MRCAHPDGLALATKPPRNGPVSPSRTAARTLADQSHSSTPARDSNVIQERCAPSRHIHDTSPFAGKAVSEDQTMTRICKIAKRTIAPLLLATSGLLVTSIAAASPASASGNAAAGHP